MDYWANFTLGWRYEFCENLIMEDVFQQILEQERFYKTNFFNTLSGIRSPFLLGTKSEKGISNLAIFNSIVHVGAKPPTLGLIFRPEVDNVRRHSLENIKEMGYFTLNLLNESILDSGHQTSAKYAEHVNEFQEVGLHEYYSATCGAPYVVESKLRIGLKPLEYHPIQANATLFMVAEIFEIFTDSQVVKSCGSLDHEKLNTLLVSGLEDYYKPTFIQKKDFARP